MSLGYAEKLSYREYVGTVGKKENWDTQDELRQKSKELACKIRDASSILIMTGAGISTASGIPDFRGPNGVWTCQKHGRPLPELKTPFVSAKPSLTHMAIVSLVADGRVKYVVSQNVDNLHRRSGLEAHHLAEVHGNCFMERCPSCGAAYLRDFEMPGIGFKPTGRSCARPRCRGKLIDGVLDWEDPLPEEELARAERVATSADLVLCLGTSLQIRPICNLPLRAKRRGGQVAIVNLQRTPKHNQADLVIHGRCDDVMALVMSELGRAVPAYVRRDCFSVRVWAVAASKNSKKVGQLVLAIGSCHGYTCPMPMLDSVWWTSANSRDELNRLALPDGLATARASVSHRPGTSPSDGSPGSRDVKRRRVTSGTNSSGAAGGGGCNGRAEGDSGQALGWQSTQQTCEGPLFLALEAEAGRLALDEPVFISVLVRMREAADPGLRMHALMLQVATGPDRLLCQPARARSCESWERASSAAVELELVTQEGPPPRWVHAVVPS